jgi:hypothetical protein
VLVSDAPDRMVRDDRRRRLGLAEARERDRIEAAFTPKRA